MTYVDTLSLATWLLLTYVSETQVMPLRLTTLTSLTPTSTERTEQTAATLKSNAIDLTSIEVATFNSSTQAGSQVTEVVVVATAAPPPAALPAPRKAPTQPTKIMCQGCTVWTPPTRHDKPVKQLGVNLTILPLGALLAFVFVICIKITHWWNEDVRKLDDHMLKIVVPFHNDDFNRRITDSPSSDGRRPSSVMGYATGPGVARRNSVITQDQSDSGAIYHNILNRRKGHTSVIVPAAAAAAATVAAVASVSRERDKTKARSDKRRSSTKSRSSSRRRSVKSPYNMQMDKHSQLKTLLRRIDSTSSAAPLVLTRRESEFFRQSSVDSGQLTNLSSDSSRVTSETDVTSGFSSESLGHKKQSFSAYLQDADQCPLCGSGDTGVGNKAGDNNEVFCTGYIEDPFVQVTADPWRTGGLLKVRDSSSSGVSSQPTTPISPRSESTETQGLLYVTYKSQVVPTEQDQSKCISRSSSIPTSGANSPTSAAPKISRSHSLNRTLSRGRLKGVTMANILGHPSTDIKAFKRDAKDYYTLNPLVSATIALSSPIVFPKIPKTAKEQRSWTSADLRRTTPDKETCFSKPVRQKPKNYSKQEEDVSYHDNCGDSCESVCKSDSTILPHDDACAEEDNSDDASTAKPTWSIGSDISRSVCDEESKSPATEECC